MEIHWSKSVQYYNNGWKALCIYWDKICSNIVNVTFQAQHFCQMYLPGINVTELEVTVGRTMLLRKQSDAVRLSMWDCIIISITLLIPIHLSRCLYLAFPLSIYSVTNDVTAGLAVPTLTSVWKAPCWEIESVWDWLLTVLFKAGNTTALSIPEVVMYVNTLI